MPVTEHRNLDNQSMLGIWQITETVEEMIRALGLSGEEDLTVSAFATELRKKQWLAYRLLIKTMLPDVSFSILYDEHGKPHLMGADYHMSVTHTGDYAAVILSQEGKTGIDLERIHSRIEKVSSRFLSTAELSAIEEGRRLEQLTVYWGAKEALYKMYGRKRLDFSKHIRIVSN